MKEHRERKIVFMGTPQFALPSLQKLYESGVKIKAVVTAPDRASGRGLKVRASDVKKKADELGIPLLQPHSLRDEEFIKSLKELEADLFVVVAFRMLPKEVWTIPPLGTINLHSSLLPHYRGAAPINHVIINGESETGVTTFFINEEIDTGGVLKQQRVKIEKGESAGSLHDKLMEKGAELLLKTVDELFRGVITPIPQESLIAKLDSPLYDAPKLNRELREIDWRESSENIERLIRGLSPYPAAFTNLVDREGEREVKIYSAKAIEGESSLAIGEIESDQKSYLKVGCGEGALLLDSLQLSGRRRLSIEQFLAGVREIEQYHFK